MTRFNGTGGESIYGRTFADESFFHKHNKAGKNNDLLSKRTVINGQCRSQH